MGDRDIIDELVEQWRSERPELGDEAYEAMSTVARLLRVGLVITPLLERVFTERGLGKGEFDVLATLRRQGAPFTMTPSTLARLLLLSPGAMTNRLDRLESAGHVRRAHDPHNRRSVLVTLTADGRRLADEALEAHLENEQTLLAALTPAERRRLDTALRQLLGALNT